MKTTVRKAYVTGAGVAARTLLDSEGRIYNPDRNAWLERSPDATAVVVTVGETYDRWCDVPAAWLGGCPYWK